MAAAGRRQEARLADNFSRIGREGTSDLDATIG